MALSHWKIFTDTKKPEAARRIIAKLQAHTDRDFVEITVCDYQKGGHVVAFDIEHEFECWPTTVYDLISCAQQIGQRWSIAGFIEEELQMIANASSVSGIKMLSCYCPWPGTPNAK